MKHQILSIIKMSGFGWENVSLFLIIPMVLTGLLVLMLFKSAGSESSSNWSFQEYKFRTKTLGLPAKSLSEKTELFGEVSYLGTEGHTAGSGDTEIKWKGINLKPIFFNS